MVNNLRAGQFCRCQADLLLGQSADKNLNPTFVFSMFVLKHLFVFSNICSNIFQTSFKHCSSIIQTFVCSQTFVGLFSINQTFAKSNICSLNVCSQSIKNLFVCFQTFVQTFFKHCSNIVQTLFRHCSDIVQTLFKHLFSNICCSAGICSQTSVCSQTFVYLFSINQTFALNVFPT